MKLVVLSDTHTNSLEELPRQVRDEISGSDYIVHAGDYTGKKLLEELRRLGNFFGVCGNMDSIELKKELSQVKILEVYNFKIGVIHPSEGGSHFGLETRIRRRLENVNVIIYGHTHNPKNKLIEGVLLFNPGSAMGVFPAMGKTFGILSIGKKVEGRIVKI